MADPLEEKWVRWAVLATAALAVLAAVSALKSGFCNTRVQLLTTMENNRWGYFQLKSMKQQAAQMQKDLFQLEALKGGTPEVQKFIERKRQEVEQEIQRYDSEKNTVKTQAEKFAEEGDLFKRKSSNFAMAVMFLQIAILLSSAAVLLKKRSLWLTGLLLGTIALIYFLNGFYLFM